MAIYLLLESLLSLLGLLLFLKSEEYILYASFERLLKLSLKVFFTYQTTSFLKFFTYKLIFNLMIF